MRFALPVLALFLALFASSAPPPPQVIIGIERIQGSEVVAESIAPPQFSFRVEAGTPELGLRNCQQITERRTTANGTSYPVVKLDCGGLVLILTGVDLTVKR